MATPRHVRTTLAFPRTCIVTLLVSVVVVLPSCRSAAVAKGEETPVPDEYVGEPIHGRVVDDQTRKPLAGVAVAATWELRGGLHGTNTGWLLLADTFTDENGEYYFPHWGPLRRPRDGALYGDQPWLWAFRGGYDPFSRASENSGWGRARSSSWNGKTISMRRAQGPRSRYAEEIGHLAADLTWHFFRSCSWEQLPRFLGAIHAEAVLLWQQGIRSGPDPHRGWERAAQTHGCRPLPAVFGDVR